MTIKELKNIINELPDDMNVFVEFYDGWDWDNSPVKQYQIDTELDSYGYGLDRTCLYLCAKECY